MMIGLVAGAVVEDVAPHCIDGSGSDSNSDSDSDLCSGSGSDSGSAWHRAKARHSSFQVQKKGNVVENARLMMKMKMNMTMMRGHFSHEFFFFPPMAGRAQFTNAEMARV